MRIAIASKFFYRRGGAEVHAIDLERALRRRGHETAVLAMAHDDNIIQTFNYYDVRSVNPFGSPAEQIKASLRMLGGAGARARAVEMLENFHPDAVHLHNVHSYLSPVVAAEAKKRGVKVVWTLHDYKLVCPAYSFMRGGELCELSRFKNGCVLRNRCLRGRVVPSAGAWIESLKWNRRALAATVDRFICPSVFMLNKMKEAGFPEEKLSVLPNFYSGPESTVKRALEKGQRKDVVYVGRLSSEKGIEVLLEASKGREWEVIIIGTGEDEDLLRKKYKEYPNIKFEGKQPKEVVFERLASARLLVLPSICFENSPLSVIEALSCGTPVVGSSIGGIPELIQATDGEVFEAGNALALRVAVEKALSRTYDYNDIAARARLKFSEENYIENLLNLYR